jgi:hypothetical protein
MHVITRPPIIRRCVSIRTWKGLAFSIKPQRVGAHACAHGQSSQCGQLQTPVPELWRRKIRGLTRPNPKKAPSPRISDMRIPQTQSSRLHSEHILISSQSALRIFVLVLRRYQYGLHPVELLIPILLPGMSGALLIVRFPSLY